MKCTALGQPDGIGATSVSGEQGKAKMRLWLTIAALSGLLAVALGAYAAHGGPVDAEDSAGQASHWVDVAWRYHMVHTLLLLALSLWMERNKRSTLLHLACGFCTLGLLLFSGSLYLMGLAGMDHLRVVVPFGGLAYLLAWAALLGEAVIGRR